MSKEKFSGTIYFNYIISDMFVVGSFIDLKKFIVYAFICYVKLKLKFKNYLLYVADSVSVLLELLEVSIHCILYARKVYPEGIFELKKKYSVPVHVRYFIWFVKINSVFYHNMI